jgi:hypothetical protein
MVYETRLFEQKNYEINCICGRRNRLSSVSENLDKVSYYLTYVT